MKTAWLKHGFWNTLEHGVIRASDALASLVLLYFLAPENFAVLALAQAWVAPVLLFFVAPEFILYRDYALWQKEGPSSLATRLRALRLFSWGKAQLALVLALVGAFLFPSETPWVSRFLALTWAFALAVAPQIAGGDREFLRVGLHLRALNGVTLYQKLTFLLGTVLAAVLLPGSLTALASVAVFSAISSAMLASLIAKRILRAQGASAAGLAGREGPSVISVVTDAVTTFSFWIHICWVLGNWVLTLDLYALGWVRPDPQALGLYAAVLKVANLSNAIPVALTNLFMLWLGRRLAESEGLKRERRELVRYSALLFGACLVQNLVLWVLAPWLFGLLSHGRWSVGEMQQMQGWLGWILAGAVLVNSLQLAAAWLRVRASARGMFFRIYLPWVAVSAALYGGAAVWLGIDGAAMANLPVALSFGILMSFQHKALRGEGLSSAR